MNLESILGGPAQKASSEAQTTLYCAFTHETILCLHGSPALVQELSGGARLPQGGWCMGPCS